MTPNGPRAIEEFAVGDAITSRDEFQPGGEIEVKHVEEVFRRTAPILNLHVAGQVIRTTGEHPFFVFLRNFTSIASRLPVNYQLTLLPKTTYLGGYSDARDSWGSR